MVVDMFRAETVVAFTARAVAELKAGVISVGFSADGAFMPVRFVGAFALNLLRRFFKIYRLRGSPGFERLKEPERVVAADNDEVKYRNDRQQRGDGVTGKQTGDYRVREENSVKQREPFYLYRYYKKQHYLIVGKHHGIRKENRQVYKFRSKVWERARNKPGDKSINQVEQYAGNVEDVEPCRSPNAFKRASG